MNTILRYILEETSRYENSITHYLYPKEADARLFNENISTINDLGRELSKVQECVSSRISFLEQSNASFKLFISNEVNSVKDLIYYKKRIHRLEKSICLERAE